MYKKSTLDWIAYILVIVGALNWGLVGAFNYNLVGMIFGGYSMITRVVYILVGLAAIYMIAKMSMKKKPMMTPPAPSAM